MKPYAEVRNRRPDFIVRYRLYAPSDGGRKVTYQHLRCDFLYEGDNPTTDGVYMIHPEFLDESGRPVSETTVVPLAGTASMWIVVPEMRISVHRSRAKVGVRGHFIEGSRKVGDVEIVQILGLYDDPITPP